MFANESLSMLIWKIMPRKTDVEGAGINLGPV